MPKRLNDVTITVTGKTKGYIDELPNPGDQFRLDVGALTVHSVETFQPDEGHERSTIKLVANVALNDAPK